MLFICILKEHVSFFYYFHLFIRIFSNLRGTTSIFLCDIKDSLVVCYTKKKLVFIKKLLFHVLSLHHTVTQTSLNSKKYRTILNEMTVQHMTPVCIQAQFKMNQIIQLILSSFCRRIVFDAISELKILGLQRFFKTSLRFLFVIKSHLSQKKNSIMCVIRKELITSYIFII